MNTLPVLYTVRKKNSLFQSRYILERLLADLLDPVSFQSDDIQVVQAREGSSVDDLDQVVFDQHFLELFQIHECVLNYLIHLVLWEADAFHLAVDIALSNTINNLIGI